MSRRVQDLNLPLIGAEESEGAGLSGGGTSDKGEDDAPFVLSEGLPAIPAKLVRKIQKGGFVDMAELLRDAGGGDSQTLQDSGT